MSDDADGRSKGPSQEPETGFDMEAYFASLRRVYGDRDGNGCVLSTEEMVSLWQEHHSSEG